MKLVDNTESLIDILKNEYGIETNEQLEEALGKQGLIDISVFVCEREKSDIE